VIEKAVVYNSENSSAKDNFSPLYNEKRLGKMDSYDVFLSGARPLITVENPDNLFLYSTLVVNNSNVLK